MIQTTRKKNSKKKLEERGWTNAFGKEPGAKVRLKIQSGAKQLKARNKGRNLPTILVLYNNVPITDRGVDSYEIKTAMYGIEKITISVANEQMDVIERGFGGKRKMTPNSNTSISAIATLHCRDDDNNCI